MAGQGGQCSVPFNRAVTIQRPRPAVLPSKHVSKLARICQPPSGWTAVLSKRGALRRPPPTRPLCSRKSPFSLRGPEAPVCLGGTMCMRMDGRCGLCIFCRAPCLTDTGSFGFTFPDSPGGQCPLSQSPEGSGGGCVCMLYLPSISDQPSPLIPALSDSNQRLSYIPSCPFSKGFKLPADAAGSSSVTHSATPTCERAGDRGVPPSAGSCVWGICAVPAAGLFPHVA